jgi:hypothetical protein
MVSTDGNFKGLDKGNVEWQPYDYKRVLTTIDPDSPIFAVFKNTNDVNSYVLVDGIGY